MLRVDTEQCRSINKNNFRHPTFSFKLVLISSQRIEVKDFVDLYFLLQEYSIWDLINAVKIKFNMNVEPFILASDFTEVINFKFLPRMLKLLSLDELKDYFLNQAKSLGRRAVE